MDASLFMSELTAQEQRDEPMVNQQTTQKTAFVQDNHRDRVRRSERMACVKNAGFRVFPARDWELSSQRCLNKDFDLIVVHEGDSLARSIELCDAIRAKKPEQALLLVTNAQVQKDYAVADDCDALTARLRSMFGQSPQGSERQPVAA